MTDDARNRERRGAIAALGGALIVAGSAHLVLFSRGASIGLSARAALILGTACVVAGVAAIALRRVVVGRTRTHALAIATMLFVANLGAIGVEAASPLDPTKPTGCVEPTRRMTMYAVELPREDGAIRIAWGLHPDHATIPGPTIEMIEGDCLAITIVNRVSADTLAELRDDPVLGSGDPSSPPLGVSLHVHGVKYTQSSDGTVENDSWVPPGGSRTYTWYAAPITATAGRVTGQGTAGYWWYHDHIVGTTHGTGGAASGLYGALIVRRATDPIPDRTFVVGMGPNATLNLRHHPDCEGPITLANSSNTCYVAAVGELVEFAVIGFGSDFHTFHLHGHNWGDNRTGILSGITDQTRLIDNRTVGPADTFGFMVRAGESVGNGAWMLHCHVQSHSDRGMTTFLHVIDPDGVVPPAPPSVHVHG